MTLGKRHVNEDAADTSNIDEVLHATGAHDTGSETLEAELRKLVPAHANWRIQHEEHRDTVDRIANQIAETLGGQVTGVVELGDADHPPVHQVTWSTPACIWTVLFHQHDPMSGLYRLHVNSYNSEVDETRLRRSNVTTQQAIKLLRDNGVLPA